MESELVKKRLNKFISETGICSRRGADKLIEEGKVLVNGETPELGTRVDETDVITIDGKPLTQKEKYVYIAFNKLTDKRHQIDNKRTHCTLLAENQEGYENLLKMTTVAHLEGYYYKPRVDWDLLKKHSKGIIALSGCLNGDLPDAILNQDDSKIRELIERFHNTFGKENFYLELQSHPSLPQQDVVNNKLIELHKELGIPVVATTDCHYAERDDNEAQDIMLCIQTARNLDDVGRMSMMNSDYSLRSPEEMWEAFSHIPEALENTHQF